MLTNAEADELIIKFISLRTKANNSKDIKDISSFKTHERICVEKFKYLISMHTDRYKSFYNYEDLVQDGLEALVKAMKNYDPKKGNIFWWFHKYIGTRISRSANLHTTIRYPLKFAKIHTPHKEITFPILVEQRFCPDKILELFETTNIVKLALKRLNKEQKNIITLAFGFNGDKPLSVNKICKKMNISRLNCIRSIISALDVLKENIQL